MCKTLTLKEAGDIKTFYCTTCISTKRENNFEVQEAHMKPVVNLTRILNLAKKHMYKFLH